MCRQLAQFRQSIADYAKSFDAAALTPAQADEVVRLCARIDASVSSVRALAASRAVEGHNWKKEGFRSAADRLAQTTGVSPSEAQRTLKTGRHLAKQPTVAQAALSGELSPAQTEAVSIGAAANPDKADELIEKAKTSSMRELLGEVTRIVADSGDRDERHRAIRAKRGIRRWTDPEGAMQGRMQGLVEDGAAIWQVLETVRRRLIIDGNEAGTGSASSSDEGTKHGERLEALDYDALMVLVDAALGRDADLDFAGLVELGLFPSALTIPRPAGDAEPTPAGGEPAKPKKRLAGSPPKIIFRVDLDTFLRGEVGDGELCEIDGHGPIPPALVRKLMLSGQVQIAYALTRATRVEGVYHQRRHATAAQKTALEFLYPECAVAGCNARLGLEDDHRVDWRKTRYTVLDLLDRLCGHHHGLKTREGWGLVDGTGKRPFVAPTDPRHPNHHPPP
jgi:hypothetical protein